MCLISMYSVLNTSSEYIYFYVSKNITSFTFLLIFKIAKSFQCILKIKTNLNFYFDTSLWILKRFYEGLNFLSSSGIVAGRVNSLSKYLLYGTMLSSSSNPRLSNSFCLQEPLKAPFNANVALLLKKRFNHIREGAALLDLT